jgi:hypothetical protein
MERFGTGPWESIPLVPDLEFQTYMQVATDVTPPSISISTSRTILWPPSGAMVPVKVAGRITDDECDGSGINPSTATYAVTDEYGKLQPTGAIHLQPDGTYSFVIQLQAVRRGTDLDGRHYIITVRAQDRTGNTGSAATCVTVPHNNGNDSRRPYLY